MRWFVSYNSDGSWPDLKTEQRNQLTEQKVRQKTELEWLSLFTKNPLKFEIKKKNLNFLFSFAKLDSAIPHAIVNFKFFNSVAFFRKEF